MKQYTWDEYYEKFYDWAESTQVRNLSGLTSLGTADEVGEIIIELQVNVPAANRLLRKAVEAKLAFSASDLIEFLCINDMALATAALYNSVSRLTSEDMEDLYGVAEDDDIIKICSEHNLTLPEDLREEEEYEDEEEESEEEPLDEVNIYVDDFVPESPAPKLGFFGTLAAIFAGASAGASSNRGGRHNGRCNGDCAHCPPHYGYRYGRWYYGHDHVHGCEFGGNKGSGSMD
ncbi:MAG: hypothetical protein Q4B18_05455 [Bacillota bacterium]|nr:hypothetical protein [Bacillota bacterium]